MSSGRLAHARRQTVQTLPIENVRDWIWTMMVQIQTILLCCQRPWVLFSFYKVSTNVAMSHVNAKKRSGLVQSTAVTSQFNALSMDRNNFQRAQNAARNKHEAIQARILELKMHRAAFLTKNRNEQEVLGTQSRMRDMLLQQKARLSRVIENERKALEACCKQSQSLQDTINQATLQYADDMAQVNDEVASTLHHESREKLRSLLSVESVEALVLPRRPAQLKAAFAEAFQILQNARHCLDQVQAERVSLTTKYDTCCNTDSPGISMDLFYDLIQCG
jgi:hypothetical protein